MPQINILSPHVADLIAAGEVVERPASVIKELMENAVDAGAHTVVVEFRSGGRQSIRITDDGCGMAPEDAGVCFLRHATSKLRDERDLEAIGTLGFRGEALAAVSSVSRITLTTRQKGAPMGVRVEVEAGDIVSMEEVGCPEGTTILVRDLFYNTPARQKFLGSDRAESGACVLAALNSALARPDISFRCLRDGQEEFFSPGDGKPLSAVYALLGRDTASGLLPLHTENAGVMVDGFVSAPAFCRGNRAGQRFFCNGRPIRSRSLQTALEQAYKNTVMVGKFPQCVLYITLPNGLVDVNVHPTKAEVRFAKEKEVFDGVYYGTLSALGLAVPGEKAVPAEEPQVSVKAPTAPVGKPAVPAEKTTAASKPQEDFFRSMDAAEFRKNLPHWEKSTPKAAPGVREAPRSAVVRDGGTPYRAEVKPLAPAAKATPSSAYAAKPKPAPETKPEPIPEKEPVQSVLDTSFEETPIRYIGEAFRTYILLEQEDKLLLIDKHAAHERILFDKMRLNDKPLMSQELLLPETFTPDGEGAELTAANLPLLEKLGFTLEPFGERAFAVRAVPADIDPGAALPLLEELCEKLREGRQLSASDVWERLAATVACKAAVKAGWETEKDELLSLARRVLKGEVTHCPHGRPVMTVLTRAELDKRFGRIV